MDYISAYPFMCLLGRSVPVRLHELDSIAEGIVDVDPVEAFKGLVLPHSVSVSLQPFDESWQIRYHERRVRLVCRAKRAGPIARGQDA